MSAVRRFAVSELQDDGQKFVTLYFFATDDMSACKQYADAMRRRGLKPQPVLVEPALKFAGFFAGSMIRARDFEDRPGRGPCFVEGRVDMVCPNGSDRFPFAHYKIALTRRVWSGTPRDITAGEVVVVPMETALDYDGRVELID